MVIIEESDDRQTATVDASPETVLAKRRPFKRISSPGSDHKKSGEFLSAGFAKMTKDTSKQSSRQNRAIRMEVVYLHMSKNSGGYSNEDRSSAGSYIGLHQRLRELDSTSENAA